MWPRLLLLITLAAGSLSAAEDKLLAAVRLADDERLAATVAADPTRLAAIFSDELRYAHSNGKIETKTTYVESLTSRNTVYESIEVLRCFPRASGLDSPHPEEFDR